MPTIEKHVPWLEKLAHDGIVYVERTKGGDFEIGEACDHYFR